MARCAEKWHNRNSMGKVRSSAVVSPPQGKVRKSSGETIWCVHYECYKYVDVCERCRVRIKCMNYRDYWEPRFDF